jgi:HEAT repeat protein
LLTALFLAFSLPFPSHCEAAASDDLSKILAEAARYESGRNIEPLQKIEQLLRDSAGKPALRSELEAATVKLLAPNATVEARRFACQILAVIGSDTAMAAVADLLKREETAGIACLALGGQRSAKAAEILRSALPSSRGRARLQIIMALGNQQDEHSVAALAELARDGDPAVADAAILALGKIGSASGHGAIAALRKEARPAQAVAVAEATLRVAEQLAAAGDSEAASAIYADLLRSDAPLHLRRGALGAVMRLDKDGGAQRVLDTLGGRDAALVPMAVARVASLKSRGEADPFVAMLPRLSPPVRVWMIEAIASRGDPAARPALRAQLAETDAAVRRAAILAVGKLDDASAVAILAKVLASAKSREELQETAVALASLRGGDATDQALAAELRQYSGETKLLLMSVLARRGSRTVLPALSREAVSSDAATARAAFQALGKIAAAGDAPAVLEALANLKAPDARLEAEQAAARVLAKTVDTPRRSAIVRATLGKNSDVESRCSLLRLLPSVADAESLAMLDGASRDNEPRIRDTAVRALGSWPDSSGWNALLAIYRQPKSDAYRVLALRALTRLASDLNAKPDAALVERYRQLLAGARDDDDRKLILGALGGVAHPDALELALPLAASAAIRAEAELAVKKIAESIQAKHPAAAQSALERLKPAKP